MGKRRARGEGSVFQLHGPDCPPSIDGRRPEHRCHGRWRAQVKLPNGKAKTATRPTMKAAREALRDMHRKMDAGIELRSDTLASWMERWITDIKPYEGRTRQATLDEYRSLAERYILPIIGNVPIDQLSADHVHQLHREMRQLPVKNGRGGVVRYGLSPTTINHAHSVLRSALMRAVDERRIAYNPAQVVRPPAVSTETRKAQPSMDELRRIRDSARTARELSRVLVAFLGLRQGEALALDWADVHEGAAGPHLVVSHSLRAVRGQGLVLQAPKTLSSTARVPLDRATAEALRLWRIESGGIGFVFPSSVGGALQPSRDYRLWQELVARAGVRHITLHSVRSALASHLNAMGLSPRVVADALRHANPDTAQRIYAKSSELEIRSALDAAWAGDS